MDNQILNNILKEYEKKRIKNQMDLDFRKKELLSSNSDLEEIENKLNSIAIKTAKSILTNSETSLKDLEISIEKLKKERASILKKLGLETSYLEPHFDCKICKDTGYFLENFETHMCNCLKQKIFDIEYNKSNMNSLDKENFETFNLNLYSDKIDVEKYNSDISPRENIAEIKKICESFINNIDDPDEKNLLFTGNTGLGKTFLSNCIANELLKKGKTVLYQTAPVMLDSIIEYRFNKTDSNILDTIQNVDLLIIDDLGTETVNSMKFTELFNIINTRLLNTNKKPLKTIISTNLSLQNLFATYDERIVSRFVGHYNICRFFGDDIRFKIKR